MTLFWNRFGHLKDRFHNCTITATLLQKVEAKGRVIPKGMRVRIVMLSRFGDVGITPNLGSTTYIARIGPGIVTEWITDIQGEPV